MKSGRRRVVFTSDAMGGELCFAEGVDSQKGRYWDPHLSGVLKPHACPFRSPLQPQRTDSALRDTRGPSAQQVHRCLASPIPASRASTHPQRTSVSSIQTVTPLLPFLLPNLRLASQYARSDISR